MNAKRFRKILLPSVILLFSLFVLGQSAWTCDTPETPDDQCYEQLDIKSVHIDGSTMHILGKHLKNGNSLEVSLGGISFPFDFYTDEEIVAIFPAVFEPGHYKLEVSTGEGHKCKDKQSVTLHHREEPPPPPPPTCPETCPPGCKGDKGDTGPQGLAGPQGPAGPAGPTGIATFKIVDEPGKEIPDTTTPLWGGTASCDQGFKVTGGGFYQENLNITLSGPVVFGPAGFVKIDNGWRVEGTPVDPNKTTTILHIWAVCACVDATVCGSTSQSGQ